MFSSRMKAEYTTILTSAMGVFDSWLVSIWIDLVTRYEWLFVLDIK